MTSTALAESLAPRSQVSVRVRDVVRRFGDRTVLDGLDLSITRG